MADSNFHFIQNILLSTISLLYLVSSHTLHSVLYIH